jgi:hypothetical protein
MKNPEKSQVETSKNVVLPVAEIPSSQTEIFDEFQRESRLLTETQTKVDQHRSWLRQRVEQLIKVLKYPKYAMISLLATIFADQALAEKPVIQTSDQKFDDKNKSSIVITEQQQSEIDSFLNNWDGNIDELFKNKDLMKRVIQRQESLNARVLEDQQELLNKRIEFNKSLLNNQEKVIPQKVLEIYASTIDTVVRNEDRQVLGGFIDYNFLDTDQEKKEFLEGLKKAGFTEEEIQKYYAFFTADEKPGIIFGEQALKENDFKDLLAHERMHQAISRLSKADQDSLKQAADSLATNFKNKEKQNVSFSDSLYHDYNKRREEQKAKLKDNDYAIFVMTEKDSFAVVRKQDLDHFRSLNPVLLDSAEDTEGVQSIVNRSTELYTYLMMGTLSPHIESYLQNNFPRAYEIYLKLKTDIYKEINKSTLEGKK